MHNVASLDFPGFSQIRKYRRSLIEVLIASLVLQLLNLAQPLVMRRFSTKSLVSKISILSIHLA